MCAPHSLGMVFLQGSKQAGGVVAMTHLFSPGPLSRNVTKSQRAPGRGLQKGLDTRSGQSRRLPAAVGPTTFLILHMRHVRCRGHRKLERGGSGAGGVAGRQRCQPELGSCSPYCRVTLPRRGRAVTDPTGQGGGRHLNLILATTTVAGSD